MRQHYRGMHQASEDWPGSPDKPHLLPSKGPVCFLLVFEFRGTNLAVNLAMDIGRNEFTASFYVGVQRSAFKLLFGSGKLELEP